MKRVVLWNLQKNSPEELQGKPISVDTDNPEFTADQMLRNRNTQEYEVRIEDPESDQDMDM
jgi:hypothetical protein